MNGTRSLAATRILCTISTYLALATAARPAIAQQILWRVAQAAPAGSRFTPAIGPDGTVYSVLDRVLHAVSPEGDVLWTVPAAPGQAAVGNDGTIYSMGSAGGRGGVQAHNPDGSLRWVFSTGDTTVAGPAVGPDGNIYAVENSLIGGPGTMGMYSLDPAGSLRWSNPGDPHLMSFGGLPHTIIFGPNRAYIAMKPTRGATPPAVWVFDFDGSQVFTLLGGCQGELAVSPLTGELVTGNGICQRVQVCDPRDGSLIWSAAPPSPSPCEGLADVAVGPDGSIYTAFCTRAFWSLTASGAQRWFLNDPALYRRMNHLAVAPDNSAVLELGAAVNSLTGRVRAFDPQSADLLWEIPLDEGDRASFTPVFDMPRRRIYFTAHGNNTSYLYAVELGGCYTDCDGSGVLDIFDFLCFQNSFVAGEPYACDCNPDPVCNIFDFLCFQDAFVAGCP